MSGTNVGREGPSRKGGGSMQGRDLEREGPSKKGGSLRKGGDQGRVVSRNGGIKKER